MASTLKYEKCPSQFDGFDIGDTVIQTKPCVCDKKVSGIDNIFVIEISFIISFWPSHIRFSCVIISNRHFLRITIIRWQIFLLSSTFGHLRHSFLCVYYQFLAISTVLMRNHIKHVFAANYQHYVAENLRI